MSPEARASAAELLRLQCLAPGVACALSAFEAFVSDALALLGAR